MTNFEKKLLQEFGYINAESIIHQCMFTIRYVPANGNFLKMTEKSIDMFPRIDAIKNAMQTSIPSTQAMLSAWY